MTPRPSPGKALAADADTVAHRRAARFGNVEVALARIDDDAARLLAGRIDDALAIKLRIDLLVGHRRNEKAAILHGRVDHGRIRLFAVITGKPGAEGAIGRGAGVLHRADDRAAFDRGSATGQRRNGADTSKSEEISSGKRRRQAHVDSIIPVGREARTHDKQS